MVARMRKPVREACDNTPHVAHDERDQRVEGLLIEISTQLLAPCCQPRWNCAVITGFLLYFHGQTITIRYVQSLNLA